MHSKSERPWIKTKVYGIIKAVDGKKEQKTTPTAKTTIIKLNLDDGVKVNYRKVQTASDGKFYEILADSKNIKAKEK